MDTLFSLIGAPLGYLMYWCFVLLGGYGAAVLLFTLLTKIILFPLSIVAQKNSIKMVKMQPELAEIRMRNGGNGELIMQETRALYKKERYSTFKGLLPLLVQIPIILGLIDVIYKPLQHLLHLDPQAITGLIARTSELLGISPGDLGYGAQLRVLEAVQGSPDAFLNMSVPGTGSLDSLITQITSIDVSFLGIDLAAIPQLGEITLIIPILSALSALVLCLVQNRYNVLQAEASFISKWGMTIFLIAFSGYFALILPCGLGLYWITGNLLSILVLAVCNLMYSPKKYIDYDKRVKPIKLTHEQRAARRVQKQVLTAREKADSKRFFTKGLKKNLVVYSEGSGYWKYFFAIVDYVTTHSNIVVHYVTSDPDDQIFKTENPQIIPYFIGQRALVSFMMRMDADIVLMTTPDLQLFHIKRSLIRKDVEYIYLDHGMTSYQLMLRKNALDYFDTIFVYGPNHIEEVRETEKLYGLSPKTLVKTGYGLLDELLERVAAIEKAAEPNAKKTDESIAEKTGELAASGKKRQILIAPSWQAGNIMDLCIDEILDTLLEHGYRIIVRPHPEYVKRYAPRMTAFIERYKHACTQIDEYGGTLEIETDFSSNETVYRSDLVITDWSSIAQEFSYATKKPSLFINTPMKIMNPEWDKLPLVPLDISLRDELGVSVDLDKLGELAQTVEDLLNKIDEYRAHITATLEQNIYDIGNAAHGGGNYLIARIKEIEYLRSVGKDPAVSARPHAIQQNTHSDEHEKNRTGRKALPHKEPA